MLGQVSQVDGNIQNNTSIKSQATVPQASTVPQSTKHQTPNTLINVFIFQMPQYSVKNNSMWVLWKVLQYLRKSRKKIKAKTRGHLITLFL